MRKNKTLSLFELLSVNCAMFNDKLKRIAVVYALFQVVIWTKAVWFFLTIGWGSVSSYNRIFFPPEMILFSLLFHETMHVVIGILALLFGKNLAKIEWPKLLATIAVAVAIHNVAYWFTKAHLSASLSVIDFFTDYIVLIAFVLLAFSLKKYIRRLEQRFKWLKTL